MSRANNVGLFQNAATFPLGVDVGAQQISIVATGVQGAGFGLRGTETHDVPKVDASQLDLALAETIASAVRDMRTRERRCILGARAGDVVTRVFRVPSGMRRAEAIRAATIEADSIVDWPTCERLVSLESIPSRPNEMVLSIGRRSAIERLVAIARAAGLRSVAVDNPGYAWRRVVPSVDAILDASGTQAELTIFGKPVGHTHVFPPRLADERLVSQVRTSLVDARREGLVDVQTLAIHGSRFRYESLEELLRDDGYAISPVVLAGLESPNWTFAFGLATWSVASRRLELA